MVSSTSCMSQKESPKLSASKWWLYTRRHSWKFLNGRVGWRHVWITEDFLLLEMKFLRPSFTTTESQGFYVMENYHALEWCFPLGWNKQVKFRISSKMFFFFFPHMGKSIPFFEVFNSAKSAFSDSVFSFGIFFG